MLFMVYSFTVFFMLSLACLADSAIISNASKKITVTKVHTLLAEQRGPQAYKPREQRTQQGLCV